MDPSGLRAPVALADARRRRRRGAKAQAIGGGGVAGRGGGVLAGAPLGQDDLVDVVDEEVEELVRVLLHIVVKLLLLLPQPRDELLRGNRAHLLLLRRYAVEQVGQACQQRLLGALVLRLVLQHLVPERLAEVEGLQNGVAVAGVAELEESETGYYCTAISTTRQEYSHLPGRSSVHWAEIGRQCRVQVAKCSPPKIDPERH